MIQIDEENLRIELLVKYNKNTDIKSRVYPLITCYMCPSCKRILRAYFKVPERTRFEIFPYEESSQAQRVFVDFWSPDHSGAGIVMKGHNPMSGRYGVCDTRVFYSMNPSENARDIGIELGAPDDKWFEEALYGGVDIDGIIMIPDMCGRDRPLIGMNEVKLNPPWSYNSGESYESFMARDKSWKGNLLEAIKEKAIQAGIPVLTTKGE